MMNTDIVVRETAGHRIYYCGLDHRVHAPRWQDTKPSAWVLATRGAAAIIAKTYGGRVTGAAQETVR